MRVIQSRGWSVPLFVVAECDEQPVSAELDVLGHECGVHADERDGQCVSDEVDFDAHSLFYNFEYSFIGKFALQFAVQEAGKVAVHAFISGDEFIGSAESGHETSFFEPEDGAEAAGEEESLNDGEGDDTLCEGGFFSFIQLMAHSALF